MSSEDRNRVYSYDFCTFLLASRDAKSVAQQVIYCFELGTSIATKPSRSVSTRPVSSRVLAFSNCLKFSACDD